MFFYFQNTSPLWDDLVIKANKLHACLKATIQAIVYYLEAFQKIADAATNSKGKTLKETVTLF